jgi:phytanoyl-CoA hydroxylase
MGEPATDLSVDSFSEHGFVVARGLADAAMVNEMRTVVERALEPLQAPVEFEADVGYPGSPSSRDAQGGATPRRLLNAYSRDDVFRRWVTEPDMTGILHRLMGSERVLMSQCHHNCVMTKHPGFSSETQWHQDIRYWSFDAPELVSVWLALGREREDNGALHVIPGSHTLRLDRGRLDAALFLRPELEENQALIARAKVVELDPGDVLFFHCRLFHEAGKNVTDRVKLSPVFTFHTPANEPIPGTRSEVYPSIAV